MTTVGTRGSTSSRSWSERLPQLGRRGEGWVALQVVLLVAIIAAGVLGAGWPGGSSGWRSAAAGLSAALGLYLFLGAATGLGRQLTPFPRPVERGSLKRSGAYRLVRHPMYGGVLFLTLAWSLLSSPLTLLPWALALVFLDAKRRREEAWLAEQHPEYEEYRQTVRSALVPFVW
jgi:protein-S-isoprenylcysteine O-methyltransferase Ste14